jgi:hypothetical protein
MATRDRTLRAWNIRINEALSRSGLDKGEFRARSAPTFSTISAARQSALKHVAAGHAPRHRQRRRAGLR